MPVKLRLDIFNCHAHSYYYHPRLCDKGGGSGALVAPGGGQDTDGLVVTRQTVDTRLDENQAELAVLVLAVTLKVLADGDGLPNH